ncbi:efflux RND transporter permease subunit, partial [Escherichia coli]|uniref:efflux RND transporter permease subunit n=1 Tax=Escherichia coli TaxID=562 RepID=UPI003FA554A9
IAPSFGATDIERLVTFPIEQANTNISGLKEIRGFSRFGLSLVTIVLDDATNIYWARQQVAERMQKDRHKFLKGLAVLPLQSLLPFFYDSIPLFPRKPHRIRPIPLPLLFR